MSILIQVRFKFFALWNRIPLFFNGQLVSSLSYPGLLVCKYMYHYDTIKLEVTIARKVLPHPLGIKGSMRNLLNKGLFI
jgi:hypothetical protein